MRDSRSVTSRSIVIASLALVVIGTAAGAQTIGGDATSEDIEPRVIGSAGTTMVGLSGYVDKLFSSETALPTTYTAVADVSRFVTQRVVVRAGIAGSGRIGGDADAASEVGDPALHAFGGALLYFTPRSMVSLYSGGEYWTPLAHRPDKDAGTIVALLGLQGAVSSRAGVFVEGGYGVRLTKGDDDELLTRIVGRIGVRLRF